jgi:hypothetical protein
LSVEAGRHWTHWRKCRIGKAQVNSCFRARPGRCDATIQALRLIAMIGVKPEGKQENPGRAKRPGLVEPDVTRFDQ